jgi:hypothetical protein
MSRGNWDVRKRSSRYPLVFVACVAFAAAGCVTGPEDPGAYPSDTGSSPSAPQESPPMAQAASPSEAQLAQLVAPIALYPDELVAQVLTAATYPAQIVEADRWLQANPSLKGDALGKSVDTQPWDPSVKALTQFPSVLGMMDKNLSWTSSLGEAYMNDQTAVMNAVQRLRQRAQQAGNLQNTPQETVTAQQQTIVIEPVDPAIVYIPAYDPWLVYGPAIDFYPGWIDYPGLYIAGPGIVFGFGVGIGVFGGYGWGWHNWGFDWRGRGVLYNRVPYFSHSPTFRGRGWGSPGRFPSTRGFARNGSPSGVGSRPALPRGGFRTGGFPSSDSFGTRSGAFSGFDHGGVTRGFSDRGRASFGGAHGGGGGGFHGGGHR